MWDTWDTLYPWTGLLIKPGLVGTHVCCLLRDRRRAALSLSCTTETETTLMPLWKTPGFSSKIRRPSTTNTIPVPEPPGNYRAFNLIQSSIITPVSLARLSRHYHVHGTFYTLKIEKDACSQERSKKTKGHTHVHKSARKKQKNLRAHSEKKKCYKNSLG